MVISCYISYVSQWYSLYISIIPWDSLQHTRDTPMIPSLHHIRIPVCYYSTSPLFHDPMTFPLYSNDFPLIISWFFHISMAFPMIIIPFKLTSKIPLILSHQTYSHKICDHDFLQVLLLIYWFKFDLPTIRRHGTFGPPQALSRHGLLGELRIAAPGVAHEGDGLAGHHANVLHITWGPWGWEESWDGDGEKHGFLGL